MAEMSSNANTTSCKYYASGKRFLECMNSIPSGLFFPFQLKLRNATLINALDSIIHRFAFGANENAMFMHQESLGAEIVA